VCPLCRAIKISILLERCIANQGQIFFHQVLEQECLTLMKYSSKKERRCSWIMKVFWKGARSEFAFFIKHLDPTHKVIMVYAAETWSGYF
jgi:hypothetical protein